MPVDTVPAIMADQVVGTVGRLLSTSSTISGKWVVPVMVGGGGGTDMQPSGLPSTTCPLRPPSEGYASTPGQCLYLPSCRERVGVGGPTGTACHAERTRPATLVTPDIAAALRDATRHAADADGRATRNTYRQSCPPGGTCRAAAVQPGSPREPPPPYSTVPALGGGGLETSAPTRMPGAPGGVLAAVAAWFAIAIAEAVGWLVVFTFITSSLIGGVPRRGRTRRCVNSPGGGVAVTFLLWMCGGLGRHHGLVGAVPMGTLTDAEFKVASWGE